MSALVKFAISAFIVSSPVPKFTVSFPLFKFRISSFALPTILFPLESSLIVSIPDISVFDKFTFPFAITVIFAVFVSSVIVKLSTSELCAVRVTPLSSVISVTVLSTFPIKLFV
ncbi:hypothetical protein ADUPG1_001965 [Aduncisulcus paluster]|uniref:Uncharacterized protein n=1 Tax=Aduncisulcus paluster TaxID=2918883 RepID=A0ABQ5KFL3_9EUKA|nr:hypothetical protein ADUPG1_001965 [Aduncisulcus paluster]